jgi:hypothetical protein
LRWSTQRPVNVATCSNALRSLVPHKNKQKTNKNKQAVVQHANKRHFAPEKIADC